MLPATTSAISPDSNVVIVKNELNKREFEEIMFIHTFLFKMKEHSKISKLILEREREGTIRAPRDDVRDVSGLERVKNENSTRERTLRNITYCTGTHCFDKTHFLCMCDVRDSVCQ